MQYQPGARPVAGELERALGVLFQQPVKVTAAGRTDAGVHASGQVVSFKAERPFAIERLALALNGNLPPDVSVREAALVDGGFSARFSARLRTYEYVILNRPMRSALAARVTWHVHRALDLERMRVAARDLFGEHDFVSFCASLPEQGGTVRTLLAVEIEAGRELVVVRVAGDGFLHKMVRNIVGTLVEIGAGDREVEAIPAILAARDRRACGVTAPPQGLCLCGVRYDGFDSYAAAPASLTR